MSSSAYLWTVTHQAPLSMGFSRQEYWSGLLCPAPVYLPNTGIKPTSLMSPALAGGFFTASTTRETCTCACKRAKLLQLCLTLCDPWTVARQAPLSMGFSRQEYWSGFPCPPLADLPNPEIKVSYISELAGRFLTIIAT